MYSTLVIMAIM